MNMLRQIAKYLTEVSKRESARDDSGVVFRQLNKRGQAIPMHHAVYMRMLRVQNGRMMELRQALANGVNPKLVLQEEEPEETEEQKQRRLRLEASALEKKRKEKQ